MSTATRPLSPRSVRNSRQVRTNRGAAGPRVALLAPAAIALLAGLDAALMLLGLPAPVTADRLPEVHGMLLVLGFVGTLVALERAVALRRPVGFAAPALLGLGGLLLLSPAPLVVGPGLVAVPGAAALVGVYVPLWRGSATTRSWSRPRRGARARRGDAVARAAPPYRRWRRGWLGSWC